MMRAKTFIFFGYGQIINESSLTGHGGQEFWRFYQKTKVLQVF